MAVLMLLVAGMFFVLVCSVLYSIRSMMPKSPKVKNFIRFCYVLLCVAFGIVLFNFVVKIPLLFVPLLFIGLLMFYYAIFWISLNCTSFRRRGRVYKTAGFALFCYWGLFLFDIYRRLLSLSAMTNISEEDFWYDRVYGIAGITDDIQTSIILSGLFVSIVYLYNRYISDKD